MAKHKRKQPRPARRRSAVTADVLGTPPKEGRVPVKWRKHYARLRQLRTDLFNHKGDLVKDANEEQPSFSLHMADAGTDSYDRDFALSRISAEQDAVYEIDEAIDRIREGTYGICEMTGKPIEAGRLEAIPWARYCAKAETQLEREGHVRRTGFAPRAGIDRSPAGKDGHSAEDDEPGQD
jgi:DnaK suppressor protein